MTQPQTEPEVLFREPGATWWWLLSGPVAAIAMLGVQLSSGYGPQPLMPVIFLVVVTFFLGIQVKASRIHASVELTSDYLRQGAETTRLSQILVIYPEATGSEVPQWQSARALGELTGVPRGRTGIGVKLAGDRTAQAWARKHRVLREALEAAVDEVSL